MFKNLFSWQLFVTGIIVLIVFTLAYKYIFTKTVVLAPTTAKDADGKDVVVYAGTISENLAFWPASKAA
jgi:hypothetical protein